MPLKNPRRFRWIIWAGAGVICLAAAVTGWMALDRVHTDDGPVNSDVFISNRGRTLTTVTSWMDCEDKPDLQAHESAHGIALTEKRKWHGQRQSSDSCHNPHGGLISTSLDKPVGDRKITDGVTGDAIITFDDTHFPYPRYLPSGFAPADKAIGPNNPLGLPNPVSNKDTWTYTYQRKPGKGGQAGALSITADAGETTPTQGTPMSFSGHAGRLQKTSDPSWTAVWTQNGYTITVWTDDPSMTDAEFLRITQSMRN
ncbi:hypothetical protein [Streptomyces alanosinicus]|uniref:Uncharacterized protein n=1 Tax=Streptomyces alanosinicus TaxID=68171 RepID=A0A918YSM8_9ACTN|nr:hypothetical protein [Streptomyces alanosinicus]GHE13811.1 hypothetical protein GCM10010339_82140 [Streptomyces alanosinicus]